MPQRSAPGPSPRDLPVAVAQAFGAAIRAAGAYRGATAPNPTVGCALLDAGGATLTVAAHRRAGQPHAEALAIETCRQRGTIDRVHTVVVTLEPCNHWGRTPPCSEAILKTPATVVWTGAADPNPRVQGGGAARLREAGLVVHELASSSDPLAAELARECDWLIAPFAKRSLFGRPWVTVKQALDTRGSMLPPAGQKTFTSPAALTFAHQLRRRSDAILTGSGTILADRPEFTVRRVPDHAEKRRHLIVLDRRRRVPADYLAAAQSRGFRAATEDDLGAALDRLGANDALEVLVEAGPSLTAAVLDGGLWDEHVIIRKGAEGEADSAELRRRGSDAVRRFALDGQEPAGL